MLWDYEDEHDLELNADLLHDEASGMAGSDIAAFSQVSLIEAIQGAIEPKTLLHSENNIRLRVRSQGGTS